MFPFGYFCYSDLLNNFFYPKSLVTLKIQWRIHKSDEFCIKYLSFIGVWLGHIVTVFL